MITIRKAEDRGHADHGWLNSFHTFSFSSYYDPNHMRFRSLRVMNEDRVSPGKGFGEHVHDNMEIVSYVLEGALEHKDSMGNGEVLKPGEFQRMSAGTGIRHSEFNPSPDEQAHFYQIWLRPAEENIEPSYEQKQFPDEELRNQLRVVASPEGHNNSLKINQDATIYLSRLDKGHTLENSFQAGRHGWLQVLRGEIGLNEMSMSAGDGAAISEESIISVQASADSEIMLFDLS